MIPDSAPMSQDVTLEDTRSPAEIEEAAALELVKRDAETAESWIEGQQWNENWRAIDILYDSPRQFAVWEGSNTQKPAVNRFILCQHVNTMHPQMSEGLFYDDQYFMPTPRPGTDNDTVRARAAFIRYQLDEMEFKSETGLGTFQQILHGTGIWKWGLRQVEEEFSEFKREKQPLTQSGPLGEEIKVETAETRTFKEVRQKRTVLKPFFENVEIRNVLVDPKLKVPDIRKARWVIHKSYLTLSDLMKLKADPNYDLPSEDEMKAWFENPKESPAILGNMDTTPGSPAIAGQGAPDWEETSDDPYEDTVMCLERTDKFKVITTINNKKVIQNRENPYGVVNYLSANFYNRIRSFWGIGLGKIVGTDQRLQQGIENSGLALLQLLLDPPFAVNEDSYAPTQNVRFRKGGFIKVKGDVRAAIAPLEMPRLPVGELFSFLQNSQAKSEAADGADQMLMGGSSQGAGRMSTKATGAVTAISGATAGRLQGPVERFVDQVFVPWIYQLDELNRRFIMTTPEGVEQVKTVLGDELGKDFKFDEDKFLSGRVIFNVLAGAHLAAKKVMAQALPILTQIFDNPAIQQQLNEIGEEYVDVKELLLMWMESTGWRNTRTLIKKMTPEMKQRQQASNPGVQKAQAEAQKNQQNFQNQQKLLQQKGEQGIARDVIAKSLDQGETGLLRKEFEHAPETLGQ